MLRDRLLQMFSPSDYARAERILNLPSLVDGKPTELAVKIRALLPSGHSDCIFVRHCFLSRLPENVRTVLMREPASSSIESLAQTADLLVTAMSSAGARFVSQAGREPEIDAVSRSFGLRHQRDDHRDARRDDRRDDHDQQQSADRSGACWYHRRFSRNSRSCRHTAEFPCSMRKYLQVEPSASAVLQENSNAGRLDW